MSYWVIIFLTCSYNKYLSCKVQYSNQIYETRSDCEYENGIHLVSGHCVETSLSPDFLDKLK